MLSENLINLNTVPRIDLFTTMEAWADVFSSSLIWGLLSLLLLDFITGTVKAFVLKEAESRVGIKGLIRNISVMLLVLFIAFFSRIFGVPIISMNVTMMFMLNYFISILENLQNMGVHLPDWMTIYFKQMQSEMDKKAIDKLKIDIDAGTDKVDINIKE